MNGSKVLSLLGSAKIDLLGAIEREKLPIYIKIDEKLAAGAGSTERSRDGKAVTARVGIRDIGDDEISDGKAMEPLVALFHEVCGHAMQQCYEFGKTSTLSKAIAANHYACSGSDTYYGWNDTENSRRYFKQPHEIAAQYMGVKCAYRWLSESLGDKAEAGRLIMAYEDYRQSIGKSWLPEDSRPKSVDDVLRGLNKAFRDSVHAQREYAPLEGDTDAIHMFVAENENNPAGQSAVRLVSDGTDGLLQDMRMAWAMSWANYGHGCDFYKNAVNVPAMKAMGIDPLKTHGLFQEDAKPFSTFPDPATLSLRKLKTLTDDIDRKDRVQAQPQTERYQPEGP